MLNKKLILGPFVLLIAAGLAGCGSSKTGSPDCQSAYNQIQTCFQSVPDCTALKSSSQKKLCAYYQHNSWDQNCGYPAMDCSCTTEVDQALALRELAVQQTAAKECKEIAPQDCELAYYQLRGCYIQANDCSKISDSKCPDIVANSWMDHCSVTPKPDDCSCGATAQKAADFIIGVAQNAVNNCKERAECVEDADCTTGTKTTCCGTSCVDVQTDDNNCGNCGDPTDPTTMCDAGESCVAGACSCGGTGADCDSTAGETCCGTACVDTTSDSNHCGDCDTTCTAPQTCTDSACSC